MSETQEIVLEGEYGPGGSWDADAHVRLLRENGGASSGYTADLIERLAADLHSATKVCRGHSQAVIAQNAEITSLRAQLAEARAKAIEECAKVAEQAGRLNEDAVFPFPRQFAESIAADIRALASLKEGE